MRQSTYKNYLLGVLTIILVFNYLDRVALGLLLQDIKADMGLSDTQLGFLTGMAFAFFYSVMGVPIARWADRSNRVMIVTVCVLLWSVFVALCGLAENFTQLLILRVFVAVGEAGCIPTALSLIADHFDRTERPRAAAIYGMGGGMSTLIGYFAAGWIGEIFGWRMAFVLLGCPGIFLAALAWFTLKEPRLSTETDAALGPSAATVAHRSVPPPSLKRVFVMLWRIDTFRHLLIGLSVVLFFVYGIGQWLPTWFIRSFGMSTGQIGTWLALAAGIGGLIGSYVGGELASRYAADNERLQMQGMVVTTLFAGGLLTITFALTSASMHWAYLLVALHVTTVTAILGPLYATIQTLVPERTRAVAIALVYLFANLTGMGLGPLAVGALSDSLHPWLGDKSLRYALLLATPFCLGAAWHLWRASITVGRDIDARGWNSA